MNRQKELEVASAAEGVLHVRSEIIRRQIIQEQLRECQRALEKDKKMHQGWESMSLGSSPDHPSSYILSSKTSTLAWLKKEQQHSKQELKALNKQRKEFAKKLLDLSPEQSTLPKTDLKMLLAPMESDDDDEV